jgi:hypothetical protein
MVIECSRPPSTARSIDPGQTASPSESEALLASMAQEPITRHAIPNGILLPCCAPSCIGRNAVSAIKCDAAIFIGEQEARYRGMNRLKLHIGFNINALF